MRKICNKITSFFKTLKNSKISYNIVKNYRYFRFKIKDIFEDIKFKLKLFRKSLKKNIVITEYKIKNSKIYTDKSIKKSFLTMIFVSILLVNSFAWLYDEFIGSGASIKIGEISHEVIQYDESGNKLESNNETQTIVYENNMSNVTKSSKFIEIKNTGTLNMEFSMAFSLEGTLETAGILYYRLYEVTDEVNNTSKGVYDTKLQAYAAANPLSASVETDTAIPISNMSLLNNLIKIDTIEKTETGNDSKYYRLDYGMYQSVNTSLYSGESFSVHMDVYSSQEGVISAENRAGQVYDVKSESQLREVLLSAIAGDTIRLVDDITVVGTVDITKRINLDTNDHTLTINGNLLYEFVSMGELKIDTSGTGRLVVNGNLYLNTPKAEVNILGDNKAYDIAVTGTTTMNAIQDGEKNGIFLEKVRMVKNTSSLIPVDITIMSNTRLTVGPNVELGVITAKENSTNIEIVNNGSITQIDLSQMKLLDTFTKAQIYVYNLGNIHGVIGSYGIILPSNATPYLGANNGNTLIIRGITSSDFTVGGSDNFNLEDIKTNEDDVTVLPIEGEENSYKVYIKDSTASIENLLTNYFRELNLIPSTNLATIKKLMIYTVNAQYVENEDFDFLKSDRLAALEYLDLENSKVIDEETVNRIKSYALSNKTTLKTVILPVSLSEIGDHAFYNVPLGYINDTFRFLEIPSTVTDIGTYAFNSSKYVKFKSVVPPTIGSHAFANDSKLFVIDGTIEEYQAISTLDASKIYQSAELSDDKRYFVYETDSGVGISYIINNYLPGTSLGIPNVVTYQGSNKKVTEIGTNSYREMEIVNTDGVALVLPTTVTSIDAYAFYNLNIIGVSLTNVINIGDYAFYNTSLESVTGNKILNIGKHSFEKSKIKTLEVKNIETIGEYAFASSPNLYEANVGTVKNIRDYAFYDCKYMTRFYFENTTSKVVNNVEQMELTIGQNAVFSNWGYYIDGRLRVYVPDGKNANGTTYLDLYQNLMNENRNYIYVTGIDINSYQYMAVPYEISEYTVREVSLKNYDNVYIDGYEIISYQGEDLDSTYQIPSALTINGTTKNVISVGTNAYMNSKVTDTIAITNNNLINVGDYAFYGIDINSVRLSSTLTIGDYAFSNTVLQTADFPRLNEIGDYALSSIPTLINLNLGTVSSIGTNSISDDENLEQLFLKNTTNSIVTSGTPFSNIGGNANNRLRIYVPNDNIDYYKKLLPSYANYIYATGFIKGSYINYPITYDIGEYSVREVQKQNKTGETITGWELIEYHGADLNSDYTLPTEISVSDTRLSATLSRNGQGTGDATNGWVATYYVNITNLGSETVNAWEAMIPTSGWDSVTIKEVAAGGSWSLSEDGSNLIIKNADYNATINPGSTVIMSFQLEWTGDRDKTASVATARELNSSEETLPVISIGENAFIHTPVKANTLINIENNNILTVENGGFENLKGIKQVKLDNVISIGERAFKNSSITIGTFTNVETVKSNAFNNANRLYILDLGKVKKLESNAISDNPYLYKLLFETSNSDLNVTFDKEAINNVGTLTNNRMRFYVTNGANEDGERYVDIYKSYFNDKYQSYFFAYDTLMGSYTPTGLDEEFDIGEYTIRDVTVKNSDDEAISGYEIVEYHGTDLTRDYEIPSELSLNDSRLSGTVSVGTDGWGSYGNRTDNLNVTITNDGSEPVGTWRIVIDISSGGPATQVNCWDGIATLEGDRVTITNQPYNGTIQPGETKSFSFQLAHKTVTMSPTVRLVKENDLGLTAVPIVSIGPNAFRYAKVTTSSYFDLTNDKLLQIGNSSFEGTSIRKVVADNVVSIGENAFKNSATLNYGSFKKLHNAGKYAFSNTGNLVYLNLGTINEFNEGLLSGAIKMTQLYINNTNIDANSKTMSISIGENAFKNVGSIIGSRLRIYVPSGSVSDVMYVDAYKATLPAELKNYIYETGTIVGSYNFSEAGYDIGEYSVITTNVNGTRGYKVVEYHGPNVDDTYTLPSSLTIGDDTYTVISIGDNAYYHVSIVNDEWNLTIPDNIKHIGNYAFYKRNIKTLTTGNLSYIGSYAFAEIDDLISVTIANVDKIDSYAFYRNINLNTVSLGNGVSEIGDFAFYNSWAENNLSSIYISTTTPPTIGENTLPSRYWQDESPDPTIYVPYESIGSYNEAENWLNYPIESIGSVYDNKYVYKVINTNQVEITNYIANEQGVVTIPESFMIDGNTYNVVAIDANAFDSSSKVTSIVIPRYVVSVGDGFLENNASVQNITVNANNTYFSSSNGILFDGVGEILLRYPKGHGGTSYNVPIGTKVIASGAFKNVDVLKRINFNSDLVVISETAFEGATNLTTLSFTGTTPPYLTSYNSFILNPGLSILYPSAYETIYKSNIFYNWYLSYLISS